MRDGLQDVLAPATGERILEVGAGNGRYAFDVAAAVGPDGAVAVVDTVPQLLDQALRGAFGLGLINLSAVLGDARSLPFDDGAFDAAYLVAALGHEQDHEEALREVARVVRAGGRVVVGELDGDPHRVDAAVLRVRCDPTPLRIVRCQAVVPGYLALLEVPPR